MQQWIAVFVVVAISDWFWARWSSACSKGSPHVASAYSVAIILCSAFAVIEYTNDHWMLIPAALGAYVGTFVAVSRRR